jgi:hypothetical protein
MLVYWVALVLSGVLVGVRMALLKLSLVKYQIGLTDRPRLGTRCEYEVPEPARHNVVNECDADLRHPGESGCELAVGGHSMFGAPTGAICWRRQEGNPDVVGVNE